MALTDGDVASQSELAAAQVGKSIVSVRYVDIDYRREEHAPGTGGPRHTVDAAEWAEPTWHATDCDTVDFGVELHMSDLSTFSISWEPPGPLIEGSYSSPRA